MSVHLHGFNVYKFFFIIPSSEYSYQCNSILKENKKNIINRLDHLDPTEKQLNPITNFCFQLYFLIFNQIIYSLSNYLTTRNKHGKKQRHAINKFRKIKNIWRQNSKAHFTKSKHILTEKSNLFMKKEVKIEKNDNWREV